MKLINEKSSLLRMLLFFALVSIIVSNNIKRNKYMKSNPGQEIEKTLSVVQFNRHGARLAKDYFSGFQSKHFFGYEKMQLTHLGFRQHRILGELVKRKYKDLLGDASKFKAYSSPVQRTIFSATGFIQGVFPNLKVQIEYEEEFRKFQFPTLEAKLYPEQTKTGYLLSEAANVEKKSDDIPLVIRDSYFHAQNCELNEKGLDKIMKEAQNADENSKNINKSKLTKIKISDEERKIAEGILDNDFQILIPKNIDNVAHFDEDGIKRNYESYNYHFGHLIQNKLDVLENAKKNVKKFSYLNKNITNYKKEDVDFALKYYKKLVMKKWWEPRLIHNNEIRDNYLKLLVKDFFIYLRLNLLENSGNSTYSSEYSKYKSDLDDMVNLDFKGLSKKEQEEKIKKIKENKELNKIKYNSGKSFTLFSGHDTNIINILANIMDQDWVIENLSYENKDFFIAPYASSIIFELVKKGQEHFIRIILNGKLLKSNPDKDNQFGIIKEYKIRSILNNSAAERIPDDGLIKLSYFLKLLETRISKTYIDCIMPEGSDE